MADPLLQGHYPMRGLYQSLAVAAMCLQEQAATRPLIGDVVTALSYLASQTYDPNAPVPQTSRIGPSTPRLREDGKNLLIGLESKHSTDSPHKDSPKLRQRDAVKVEADGGSGRKWSLEELESMQDSPSYSPVLLGKPRDSPRSLDQDPDRERAIAEAKVWGENWRERKKGNAGNFDSTYEEEEEDY
ncbi:hypothetical protein M5K25_000409 [Dendrobium thyrsiflorum]